MDADYRRRDADYCRRQAEHYRICAGHMTDVIDRATFFGLAALWALRAKDAERKAEGEKSGLAADPHTDVLTVTPQGEADSSTE